MAYRQLTGNNNTVDITETIGAKYAGTLRGVRAIPFGQNRDGTPDIRFIADFGGRDPDGKDDWSAWLATQLKNLLVDLETKNLLVPRDSPILLTYTGTVKSKSGGQPTHIFDVQIGDPGDALPSLEDEVIGKRVAAAGRKK